MPVILTKHFPAVIADIDAEVKHRLGRGASDSFLYIAPTRRKVRSLQREFLGYVPGGASSAFNLYTLETLATMIHGMILPPRRFISGPVQAVFVHEAMCAVEDSLSYFKAKGGLRKLPKGTLQNVIETIDYLRDRGMYRSILLAELEHAGEGELPKLRDIVAIIEAYESLLGDRFVDAAGVFQQVNFSWDAAESGKIVRDSFPRANLIVVSGFDEFSDPELTLLHNLSSMEGFSTLVSFDYHPENDEIFGHLRENYEKFIGMGFQKQTITAVELPSFRSTVTLHGFRPDPPAERFNCSDTVSLLQADDRQSEVELIAKIVKRLALEKPDRDLSRICVAMYSPDIYTALFREAFERHGIPANITDRYYLEQSPFVVSLLSFLSIHHHNYRTRDLMRALGSPYICVTSPGGESVDAGNIHSVSVRLKISAGRSVWTRRVDQRLREIASERLMSADDAGEERLSREDASLRKAQADLAVVESYLAPFQRPMTPLAFKTNLVDLLQQLHLVERILQVPREAFSDEQIERDTRAYQKFLNFIDEFLEVLSYQPDGDRPAPLGYYLDQLRAVIPQARYNVRQRYGQGTLVTSFDETRGLSFDVMIIAGMVDGEFPPRFAPEVFLPESRRARRERYHLHEHRYLFYQAITNFTEHLYITYPKREGDIELVPSSFLESLLKVSTPEDHRSALPASLLDPVFSEDELVRRIGYNIGIDISNNEQPSVKMDEKIRDAFRLLIAEIERAIRIEQSRTEGSPVLSHAGMILDDSSPEARAALERFRSHVYSVTQLESYGSCPFQFFAERVLRLKPAEEVEEEFSPLERGTLLHDVLFEFYTSRRDRDLPPISGLDEEMFQTALVELTAIARKKLATYEIDDIFWDIDKEVILGAPNRTGILKELLDHERAQELSVRPAYFEVAFGENPRPDRNSDAMLRHSDPIVAGKVKLRGKIDRIDSGDSSFRIIDYKTGKHIAGKNEIDLGMSLQLPVYLYAVERIFAANLSRQRSGAAGIYYKLYHPVKEKVGLGSAEHRDEAFIVEKKTKEVVASDRELAEVIERAIRYVNDYVDGIAAGIFPVEPKLPQKVCEHCDFNSVCRIQTMISISPEEAQ